MNKMINIFREIFSKRKNIVIAIVCFIVLLAVVLILKFGKFGNGGFVLDQIYDVYPKDVRDLYSNVVEVSCYGDLHFDIELDGGEKKINDINKNNLIDYLFSNLSKNDLLTDNIEEELFNKTEKKLFLDSKNLINEIKDYNYNGYIYNYDKGMITRKKSECNSDIKNILHLYGYSHNKKELSIDINVAYLKDGKLFDLNNHELGEYDGDKSKLFELTQSTSYYRLNYVKRNGIFKLSSIEWKSRT